MKRQGEGGIIGAANDPEMGGGLTEFTSSGNFTANPGTDSIEWLVIAGGGGGGGDDWGLGGGGGAGGYRNSFNNEQSGGGASSESPSPITGGNTYTVTVGAGGVGAPCEPGQNVAGSDGSDSSISGTGITTITSTGGGGGGLNAGPAGWPDALPGRSGGSGGGTAHRDSSIAWPGGPDHYAGGAGTANQGYAGGSVTSTNWWGWGGSGGGGAGGAGTRDSVVTACPDAAGCPWDPNYPSGNFWYWHSAGGLGGAGLSSSITGLPIGRAGGAWGGSSSHGNIVEYPLAPVTTTQTARSTRVSASGLSAYPQVELKGWGDDMHDATIEEGGTSVDNVFKIGNVPGWGQNCYKSDFRTTYGAGISQEELMSHATGFSDAIANTGSGGGAGKGAYVYATPNAPAEPWAGPMPARRSSGQGGSGYVAIVEPRTITSASGVWSLDDVINYKKEGNWE